MRDAVVDVLVHLKAAEMTITQVRGSGQQRGHCELYCGLDYMVDLLPQVKKDYDSLKAGEGTQRTVPPGRGADDPDPSSLS